MIQFFKKAQMELNTQPDLLDKPLNVINFYSKKYKPWTAETSED